MIGDLAQVQENNHSDSDDESKSKPTENNVSENSNQNSSQDNFESKSPSAVDYSDINELAEDELHDEQKV